jgi:hypothetical protein
MDRVVLKAFTGVLYEFIDEYLEVPKVFKDIELIEDVNEESSGWYSLTFRSNEPMMGEDKMLVPPPYYYPFLVRVSSGKKRLLLLSLDDSLINKLLALMDWARRIKPAQIKIPDLVKQLTEKPDAYSLSIVFARVDGYGRSLRAISIYGTDLGDAQLFRDILPKLVPFRVQLRNVRTGEEVLQIGTKGEVGFSYRDATTLQKVDKALIFLTRHGFLIWD